MGGVPRGAAGGVLRTAFCLSIFGSVVSAQVALLEVQGSAARDKLGISVAAGDVNGDGVSDLILGAYQAGGAERGYVAVVSGLDGTPVAQHFGANVGDRFGRAVAFTGDVNDDGFGDFLVGAYQPFGAGPGYVVLYSGRDGQVLGEFTGDSLDDNFGGALVGGRDLDGDDVPDFVVGAPQRQSGNNGYVRAYSGHDGALLFGAGGSEPGAMFGSAVALVDDLDGDQVPDVLVGEPRLDRPLAIGRAHGLSGRTGQVLLTLQGDQPGDDFGVSVAGLGDLDGDGVPELLIGAPGGFGPGLRSGYARVFSGRTGVRRFTITGETTDAFLGFSVTGMGDLDHDGLADLAVGAFGTSAGGALAGSVCLHSGWNGDEISRVTGPAPDDHLGISLARAGDVDEDGFEDFLAGAFRADFGELAEAGRATLYSGKPTGRRRTGRPTLLVREELLLESDVGQPGEEVLVVIRDIDGMPLMRSLVRSRYDDYGYFAMRLAVPWEAVGYRFTFRLYFNDAMGRLSYHDQSYLVY